MTCKDKGICGGTMKNFSENTRVQVPAALHLWRLGYEYLDDIKVYDVRTNILTDVFLSSLKRLNPEMTEREAQTLLSRIVSISDNDDLGREFYRLVSGQGGVKLIDYEDPTKNIWQETTEFTCENPDTKDNFRPDVTCFINGLPLAFIEVKIPNNHEGILKERDRIVSRIHNRAFRPFLNITQLMIFSNNQEYETDSTVPIQGAFYSCSSKESVFFNLFREQDKAIIPDYPYREMTEEVENMVLRHRNCVSIKALAEYHTNKSITSPTNRILTSMLSKERILFLLRYGIAYVDKEVKQPDGTLSNKLEKHIMRYQQLFASLAIRKKLDRGIKSGIIWHTQGSGKTALAYYSVLSLRDFYARKKVAVKFYFIVDRLDLMEQAKREFTARGLIVRTASSRNELMADIASSALTENKEGKSEIMVVNIQKFATDKAKVQIDTGYSTHLQRIFFIDEAHRGYDAHGCFLANLLQADQEAVKIALTGTPLLKEERESWRVFGDYIDTYYYDKSIADGYTRKLMREPVETIYKERIEAAIEALAGEVNVKKSDVRKEDILVHEKYMSALLDYIITDFRRFRIEQDDERVGAMIVCQSNPQARKMYDMWQARFALSREMEKERQEELQRQLLRGGDPMLSTYKIKAPLKAALILHDEGDKNFRKDLVTAFKEDQTIDILIVNEMLLTGFDAPRLKKLYLGRTLEGHNLLQALTRVNRPYHDFKYGYVVDFVNIKEKFDETNDRYLRELRRTYEDEGQQMDIASAILEDKDSILSQMQELRDVMFDYTTDNVEEFRKELDTIHDKEQLYKLRSTLAGGKAIMNYVRSYGDAQLKEKVSALAPGAVPLLLTEVNRRIERINLLEGIEHKADVSGIINLTLSELEFEFKKGLSEELRICVNDLRERCERVQAEFDANFDQKEDQYVNLAEEFRAYFHKKGFIPKDTHDARESIAYMDEVMKKIKEINRRNEVLKRKYAGDERFVRVHKRIMERNRDRGSTPLISKSEYAVAEALNEMKKEIDAMLFLNIQILTDNDGEFFKTDSLARISQTLRSLKIPADIEERKYINNLITSEYFGQCNPAYSRR